MGVTWVIPTRAICTAICSISRGSPPLARSSRRTSSSLSTRSTGWPPASSTRRVNSSTAGPVRGSWAAGTRSGPSRTTRRPGAGLRGSSTWSARAPRMVADMTSATTSSKSSTSTPSTTSQSRRLSSARYQRSLERVGRGDHDLQLVEAGAQQVRELADASGVDPGDVVPVAHEGAQHGRLPAARGTDEADPALGVQGRGQHGQHVLAPDHSAVHPAILPRGRRRPTGRSRIGDCPRAEYVVG